MPDSFRFSAKLPKEVTHQLRLVGALPRTAQFLQEVSILGDKLALLLAQLPPSLQFDRSIAHSFFTDFQRLTPIAIVCEARHPTWFTPEADALLAVLHVARVAADPAITPAGALPGGWRGLAYLRLHGSPKMYRSTYSAEFLTGLAQTLRAEHARSAETWCIFDNTTLGAATRNALDLMHQLSPT